ncbi:phage tail protein [Bacillus marasmi]|uniref:phage tail protein n=1 Tax=Bacillus marasmi TaxID=1926279 RepID=UPI0011CBC18D|nr:phage tail protein [Bacillus marasmi]
MLAIKDLNGEVYPLTGASDIIRKRRVNGEKEFYLKLHKTRSNAPFFDNIDKLWRVIDFAGEEYPIMLLRDVSEGNSYTREFSCLHSFFDDMRNHVIYETFSSSKTFDDMMAFIFTGSGYSYNIIGTFYAREFENFGDDYGLELFKTAIERYGAEFSVTGNNINLRTQIGNITDFQYRHKFNLESLEREVDALDFSTYGEFFGKDDLHITYTSPLAEVYGVRPIKAIRDDRVTDTETATNRLKEAVDNSWKITLTVKLSDLRAAGYNRNHPNEGDTIILVDDRLNGFKVDARIVEIVEKLSRKGKVLDCDVTLSNFSNIFEQQRRIHNATKTIADAIDGKRPLPFEALAIAVQQATKDLQNAQTEITFPENGGFLLIDKIDPNILVVINSAGIGCSEDGGQTFNYAMTGKGIVADLITVGYMLFDRIRGGTLILGGPENGNGKMQVLDAMGEIIADLDAERGGFDKLYVGDLYSPTVERVNKTDVNLYVDPLNGDDNDDGFTWGTAKRTVQGALDSLDKINYAVCTIRVHVDNGRNIFENINIFGFHGSGDIIIDFQTKLNKVIGTVLAKGCTNGIEMRNGTVNTDSETFAAIKADRCKYVNLIGMEVFGNNKSYAAYVVSGGTAARLHNCKGWNVADVVRSESNSHVYIDNCDGLASSSGLAAVDTGIIRGYGAAPAGATQNIYEARGGDVLSNFTFPSAPVPPTPPPPPEATRQIGTNSGNNWSESGYWSNDGVKQGNYGYGNRRGCWFFGTSILDTIGTGKTIKSMRVHVTRTNNGGSSSPQRLSLRAHGHTGQPGGAPSLSGEIGSISLGWGHSGWINVSSSVYAAFANGSYRGFGLYSDNGSNYAICTTSCTVEITYQ